MIEHVVVIVKENHTFDNYFGAYPGARGQANPPAPNPPPADPSHTHASWMNRAADTAHKVSYGQADIPAYWDLASKFALCDNYFSEVAGPSTPNHCMIVAADAPIINNPYGMYRPSVKSRWKLKCTPNLLNAVHKTWAAYGSYVFGYFTGLSTSKHLHGRDQFAKDAAAGKLATVSYVYGDGKPNQSEHPVQNVTAGANWTAEQIKAIASGPLWDKTMTVVTWDDWGGWFDHVQPAVVETWDPNHAQHPADAHKSYAGQPFRYGSRVPCLLIGPYAKPNYVSHQLNSHVSIPRLISDLFELPHLSLRDQESNGLTDLYDLNQTPNPPYS